MNQLPVIGGLRHHCDIPLARVLIPTRSVAKMPPRRSKSVYASVDVYVTLLG
jgi:hypothetical protein